MAFKRKNGLAWNLEGSKGGGGEIEVLKVNRWSIMRIE